MCISPSEETLAASTDRSQIYHIALATAEMSKVPWEHDVSGDDPDGFHRTDACSCIVFIIRVHGLTLSFCPTLFTRGPSPVCPSVSANRSSPPAPWTTPYASGITRLGKSSFSLHFWCILLLVSTSKHTVYIITVLSLFWD